MGSVPTLAIEVATGIALASCAGLRAFLPLFVTGALGRLGWISLSPSFEWLSSWPALVIFGVAVGTEMLGDKIPIVDHLLDMLQLFVKPAAGALLAASVLTGLSPLETAVLAIVAGGSTAGIVHAMKAKLRLLSTAATSGLGNPVLSIGEDFASLVGTIGAFLAPLAMVVLIGACFLALAIAVRRFRRRAARFGR